MELLQSIAYMGVIALVMLVGGYVLLGLVRQGYGDARPMLLERALRRQGDTVAHLALASGSRDFAVAIRRCVDCNEAAQCRAWLASGARDGYQSFCPNAGFIERMKRLAA